MAVGRKRFLDEFSASLRDEAGALFVGAGVSMAAGYPSWSGLLEEIGDELGVSSRDVHDLAALAQWSVASSGGATRVRDVIKREIGRDLPVPDVVEVISRLPARAIWTTNYDRLVERGFEAISRPLDVVSGAKDLSLRATPGAARLYKMHGSIERLDDVVISTDDYELYQSTRGAFLPLLQAHLTSMSMLFVGLSLTDPNVRHVLSIIRASFTQAPPQHFALLRPPHRDEFRSDTEFQAKAAQHQHWADDLRRYGLHAVEVDDYAEVPVLLRRLERRVARHRVWISGSWPAGAADDMALKVHATADLVGRTVGELGRTLVTGSGLVVGSASVGGFLEALRGSGGWDLDRRLVARSFPQPFAGQTPDAAAWTLLRTELARLSGAVVFVGGLKTGATGPVAAAGMREEYELAKAAGTFLLPVGATGGEAAAITSELRGCALEADGPDAVRPTDAELDGLADATRSPSELAKLVRVVLRRVGGAI